MITRRAALAGGAGLLLGAPALARAQVQGDAALLARALRLEQLSAAAYGAAAAGEVLPVEVAGLAAAIAGHEQQHADELGRHLEAVGGARGEAPPDLPAVDAAAGELGLEPLSPALEGGGAAFLEWAEALERRSVALHVDAVRRGLDVGILQTLLAILAAEGQHLAVVRAARGEAPVPDAFERGA